MLVAGLWRYPVKSLGGEPLESVAVEARGVVGDRLWALVDADGKLASGKDSRRFRRLPGLLMHSAALVDGAPVISAPLERIAPGWELRRETATPHHDAAPIHLVTTTTLARLEIEPDRLRPNLLLEGPLDDDDLVGRTLAIGEVTLRVTDPTVRCVMVTQERPGLAHVPELLKRIGPLAGVYAEVLSPGTIARGAEVWLR